MHYSHRCFYTSTLSSFIHSIAYIIGLFVLKIYTNFIIWQISLDRLLFSLNILFLGLLHIDTFTFTIWMIHGYSPSGPQKLIRWLPFFHSHWSPINVCTPNSISPSASEKPACITWVGTPSKGTVLWWVSFWVLKQISRFSPFHDKASIWILNLVLLFGGLCLILHDFLHYGFLPPWPIKNLSHLVLEGSSNKNVTSFDLQSPISDLSSQPPY